MADYLVTYKFIGLTREELDKLIDEICEEMGIVPLRVEKVEDVLNIGDMVWVKVTDIDDKGRVNLSYKDAIKEIKAKQAAGESVK